MKKHRQIEEILNKLISLSFFSGNGIGRLLAIMFAKHDCKVVLWDVNSEGNEETAEEIKKMGKTCYAYTVDLSIKDEVYKTAEKVRKTFTFLIYHLRFFLIKTHFHHLNIQCRASV